MSQSQQVVNFSSSFLLANRYDPKSTKSLFESYLNEAQTIKDAPRCLCPKSAVDIASLSVSQTKAFDSTKTQWDPQQHSQESHAIKPHTNHHYKQTTHLGSARTHNPKFNSDADDPIPTPTPQAVRMPVTTISDSMDIPAHLPQHPSSVKSPDLIRHFPVRIATVSTKFLDVKILVEGSFLPGPPGFPLQDFWWIDFTPSSTRIPSTRIIVVRSLLLAPP